jgi:protocatechuate 3,4-dioxygenase beta subunit
MLSASAQSKLLVTGLILATSLQVACRRKSSGQTTETGPAEVNLHPVALAPTNLEGVVKDRRGVPLSDVLVIAWPKGKRGEAVAQARSDEEGRFLLPGLRPDRWMLLVEAPGLGTLETERQVPEDGPAELMVDGESRTLSGVVVDSSGKQQAGARVVVGGPGMRWTRAATSDASGIFIMNGLGNGRFSLRATLNLSASAATTLVLDEAVLRPAHARLVLQPGVFVGGRVMDDHGRLLPGAIVDVLAMPTDDLPLSGQAASDGRYSLGPIAPGKYQVLARLDNYVLLDAPEPQLGPHARASFDLRLARTARILGRVLDESGQPIAGVQVSAISLIGGRDELVVIPGSLPLAAEAAELPADKLIRPGGMRSSSTDATGAFAIRGLSPGRARIVIRHPRKLPFRREPLLLVPGDVRDLGDLTLISGASLACQVLDEADHAVEGAVVDARPAGKPARSAVRVTTDAKGAFFVQVPHGDYVLAARTDNLVLPAPMSIHLAGDVSADSCVLRLVPRNPTAR